MHAPYIFSKPPVKKTLSGAVMLVLLQLSACTKDTGNYTYHDINDIIIGLPDLVVVDRDKTTVVDPQVRYTMDTVATNNANYKFEWHIQTGMYDYDTAADYTTPTLTVTPTSDFLTDKASGVDPEVVSCNLVVTDRRTGLYTRKNFKMAIHTTTNFGWSLLCEKAGKSTLGMLSYSTDTSFESHADVLAFLGKPALNLTGKPLNILQSAWWSGVSNRYINVISTEKQVYAALTANLSPMNAQFYDTYFPFVASSQQPVKIKRVGGGSIGLFARQEKEIYGVIPCATFQPSFMFAYQPAALNNYGLLSPSSNPDPIYNSPYYYGYGDIPGLVKRVFLFNEDSHRFHTLQSFPTAEADLTITGGPDLTGFQLRYFNGIYHPETTQATLYALFMEVATNDIYALVFEDNGILRSWKKLPGLKDGGFSNVTLRPASGQIVYNIAGKVYGYDHTAGRISLLLDVNNEKISVMRFHEFNSSFGVTQDVDTWRKYYNSLSEKLIVCTYSESDPDHSGKFTMYDVSPSGLQLVKNKSYGGLAKVTDFTFNQLYN